MPRPRKIIDAGQFTVDLRNLEYMKKAYDSERDVYGITFVFFSGAHQTAWWLYQHRRDEEYQKFTREFQNYHG